MNFNRDDGPPIKVDPKTGRLVLREHLVQNPAHIPILQNAIDVVDIPDIDGDGTVVAKVLPP